MPEFKNYLWVMIGVFAIICLAMLWLFHAMGVLDDICVFIIVLPASLPFLRLKKWLRLD